MNETNKPKANKTTTTNAVKRLTKPQFEARCSFDKKLIALPITKDEAFNFYMALPDSVCNDIFKEKDITLKPLSDSEIMELKGAYMEITKGEKSNVFGIDKTEVIKILRKDAKSNKDFKDYLESRKFDNRITLDANKDWKETNVSAEKVGSVIKVLLEKVKVKW